MKGDFLGFSFDGIHCSELGITHVSDSDRYDESLHPEVRDKSVEIPGNHGEYFYGSTYGTRKFDLSFAYDHVTEEQFRKIRKLFGTRKPCELIFDERPYKVYYAKIENPVEMKYICFDEEDYIWERHDTEEDNGGYIPGSIDHKIYTGNYRRIYKGEGTISFVCHFPFARQLFKIKELYEETSQNSNIITSYTNVNEWIESSGILDRQLYDGFNIDKVIVSDVEGYSFKIPVYNPGDLDTGFCLYIPFDDNGKILTKEGMDVIIINGDENVLILDNEIERRNPLETGILINTNNHLIEGVNLSQIANLSDSRKPAWQSIGTIYNDHIIEGDFPYIKRNDWRLDGIQYPQAIHISCSDDIEGIGIYYNYLYF